MKNNFWLHYAIINVLFFLVPFIVAMTGIYTGFGFSFMYGGVFGAIISVMFFGIRSIGAVILSTFIFNLLYVFIYMKLFKIKRLILIYLFSFLSIGFSAFIGYGLLGTL